MNMKRIRYRLYLYQFKNKIKEIDLERLGKSYECCIVKFKESVTFEQYIDMWKSRGYKII